MFPRLIKRALPGIFSLLFLCCAFVDLRPIGVSTVPAGPWALLPGAESPVIVCFDTEMEKSSAERTLQVYSPAGNVEGKLYWEGRDLFFVPFAPWRPGIRYGLKLSGTVTAQDGRELVLSMDFPFYAVSRSSLPYIDSFFPPDGASVGVSGTVMLELRFSHSMDSRTTGEALKLDIPGEKIFEWLDDYKTLRIGSDQALNPWIVYKWSVSERALSREGAPLSKEVSGRFITDLDKEFLKVVRVVPLLPPQPFPVTFSSAGELWGSWVPAAPSLEQGPGHGHGIGVEFNKPPDIDDLRRAFSFVPSLPGRVEILSPVSAVFIPAKDPEPETVYSLRISGAMRDREGLKMGEDYTISFKTDIPFLRVLSFSAGDITDEPKSGACFSVPVNTGGIIQYILHFSLPFDSAVREECAFRISLRPHFPMSLPSVSLRTARWIFPDRLLMEWEGPEAGSSVIGGGGESHYYRLLIPGGTGGVYNGQGSYLKEDFILYLEAEE